MALESRMVYKLLENKLVSEISNRRFKEGLSKVQKTSNKYKWGECMNMCRYILFCWGEGAELPQRGHDSKKGATITIKITFFYLVKG